MSGGSGHVRLYGGFAILSSNLEPVPLSGRKERELLVAIALDQGSKVSRERLVADLWDSDDFSARRSLNTALWRLRKCVREAGLDCDDWFDTGTDYIRLRSRRGPDVDAIGVRDMIRDFRDGVADAEIAAKCLAALPCDLLPNLTPDWLEERRRQLEAERVQASIDIAQSLMEREPNWAIELTNTAIGLDPYEERAWRALISAYMSSGRRAQAHATYSKLETLLSDELGIAPSAETQALMAPSPTPPAGHQGGIARPEATAIGKRLGTLSDALTIVLDEIDTLRAELCAA